ncbi:GNAT family N-acetyltransferase [Leclercia pneumoniae]|uniref:GNAT family N-acetyltransferase n=1 Tax=Leclercia pneumoniae TaxID=2815358 RepID=UPI0039906D6A
MAVDVSFRGKGLGADLLHDAVLRCFRVAEKSRRPCDHGSCTDRRSQKFYLHHGFKASQPMS